MLGTTIPIEETRAFFEEQVAIHKNPDFILSDPISIVTKKIVLPQK
jgi:hypothetical protein